MVDITTLAKSPALHRKRLFETFFIGRLDSPFGRITVCMYSSLAKLSADFQLLSLLPGSCPANEPR
ncbi:hypothetical protein BLAT2472_30320 [Burkholderia latens]